MDDHIEEFYLDTPGTTIYLDHSDWGRCETNILLNRDDVGSLITHLKAESGLPLDFSSPSLKTDLRTNFFKLRVSVDMPPLSENDYSVILRKFRTKPFTLIDLIRNNTLSVEAAAYLVYALLNRRNILVIGEPASGKTTLINALDMLTPPYWRKLTVEAVVESINQLSYGKHQVRYKVDPFEAASPNRRKITESIRLLHRSPNYIFFGELLTAEHVKALFQALESGLKGLQTAHASSPEALIRKWVLYFKIPLISILNLDIIVQMKRILTYSSNRRFISRVSEPLMEPSSTNINDLKLVDIFVYDALLDHLVPTDKLYDSPLVYTLEKESLDRGSFYAGWKVCIDAFHYILKMNEVSPGMLCKIFAKIDYLLKNKIDAFDLRRIISEQIT